jgi:hypothetical protein
MPLENRAGPSCWSANWKRSPINEIITKKSKRASAQYFWRSSFCIAVKVSFAVARAFSAISVGNAAIALSSACKHTRCLHLTTQIASCQQAKNNSEENVARVCVQKPAKGRFLYTSGYESSLILPNQDDQAAPLHSGNIRPAKEKEHKGLLKHPG